MKQSKTSNYIPQDLIDDIREKCDIVQVISDRGLALQPSGKEYKALCPFHEEKTPSFYVSPEKQMFYCFGCQAGGTVFTFLQKYEGMSYIDAVKEVADRVGVTLPGQSGQSKRSSVNRTSIRELNEFAVEFFQRKLKDSRTGGKALDYLKRRGVHYKTIVEMKLGYAPTGDELLKTAIRQGFSIKLLQEGGLIKERYGRESDRFRNRLIFPIFDERSVPAGFGGRALDDALPKYLNSPETLLYQKSKILYNLNFAKTTIQKSKEAILVEGYMDTVIPYQAGVANIVASLGTSLSERHAKLLKRWTETVIIVYDGDPAGIRAALRGLGILIKEGLRVKVAVLPEDTDPDDFVRKNGVQDFRDLIKKAENVIDFQIQLATKEGNIAEVDTKIQIVKELADTLSNVQSNIELSEYINTLSEQLKIDRELLISDLRKHGVAMTEVRDWNSGKRQSKGRSVKSSKRIESQTYIEWHLIKLLLLKPDLIGKVKLHLNYNDFSNKYAEEIAHMLWLQCEKSPDVDVPKLIDSCTDEKIREIMSKLIFNGSKPQRRILDGSKPLQLEENVAEYRVKGCVIKMIDQMLKNLEKQLRLSADSANEDDLEKLVRLHERRKNLKRIDI